MWLAVPEYDAKGREHIHFFTDGTVEHQVLMNQWIKPFDAPDSSFFGIKVINSIAGARKYATYTGKNFDLPATERPSARRYRQSLDPMPRPITFDGVTKQDLDVIRAQIELVTGAQIKTWTDGQFWCPQVDRWDPTPASIRIVTELLNSYKPT